MFNDTPARKTDRLLGAIVAWRRYRESNPVPTKSLADVLVTALLRPILSALSRL